MTTELQINSSKILNKITEILSLGTTEQEQIIIAATLLASARQILEFHAGSEETDKIFSAYIGTNHEEYTHSVH